MAQLLPIVITPEIGIQRDGTMYDTNKFTDGVWTRFYKNRAQKMGGYTIVDDGTDTIIRNLFSLNSQDSIILYIGRPTGLFYIVINPDLSTSGEINVTPSDYVYNINTTWSLATISYNNIDYILAIPLSNATDISNNTPGILYYGTVGVPGVLTAVSGAPSVTGGVVSVGNFIFLFGSNGTVYWNDGGTLDGWDTVNDKIVYETTQFVVAAPVRSGNTLSALFWSLDFVAQLSYNGTTPTNGTFVSNYVSTQSTLLSANCVVSLDPFFYWIGNNSFYVFNGSVGEFENITNKEWFFANLNRDEKQKVYGFANRIYNEIWWLFPYGTATENTNACICNIENQAQPFWFDTANIPRAAAVSSSTQFPYPLMASSQPVQNGSTTIYPIWAHDYGTDQVQLGQTTAIYSSFTTNWMTASDLDPTMDVMILDTIIPDILQSGKMSVTINTKGYPNSTSNVSPLFLLDTTTEFLTVRQKGTLFNLTFTSSQVGGAFLMGKTRVLVKDAGDERMGPSVS